MLFNKLKEQLTLLVLVLIFSATMVACSDSDDEPAVTPEDTELPYIGAWLWEWDDDDCQIIVLDKPSRATLYETTRELFKDGQYEDKTTGKYIEEDENTIRVTIDGEYGYIYIKGSGNNKYLEIDGKAGRRINRSDVPTEKYVPGGSTNKDVLSNTSWKIISITGAAEDESEFFENAQLRFGSNGKLTEWYSNSESYVGSYSISGSTLTIDNIPIQNTCGSKYDFTLSGSKLTLIADKGSWMESKINLTKL